MSLYRDAAYVAVSEFMEKIAKDENTKGRKRPVLRGPWGKMIPVPWVGGGFPGTNQWKRVDAYRSNEAEREHLCIVCGEHRGDNWVYAALNGETVSDHSGFSMFGQLPSPTYGHPGCILKAVLFCPHFKNLEYPAMMKDKKTRLTVDDLKTLAKEEKKQLDSKRDSFAAGSAELGKYGARRNHAAVR